MRIPAVPRPMGAALAALPQFPHSVLLCVATNLFLRNLWQDGDAACVEGKVIRLCVRDAGIRATVRVVGGRYRPCAASARPDVTISAGTREFVLMALRQEDPDTLFFERRLSIEGDTALGLLVKNALDRVELPLPGRLLAHLRNHIT